MSLCPYVSQPTSLVHKILTQDEVKWLGKQIDQKRYTYKKINDDFNISTARLARYVEVFP